MKEISNSSSSHNKSDGGLLENLLDKEIDTVLSDGSVGCLNYKKSWQPCIYGEFIDDKWVKRHFFSSYEESNAEDVEFSFAEKLGIKKNNKLKIIWTAKIHINNEDIIWFSNVTWKFDTMIWNRFVYSAIWRSTENMVANRKVKKNEVKSNFHILQKNCSSDISWIFTEYLSGDIIDIFSQENIITELNNMGTTFVSHLYCGPRSPISSPMRHWADMLPWMIGWLKNFLEKKGVWWWWISKIRFIKSTYGDLTYTITNQEDKEKQNTANIVGDFLDASWSKYYYYGKETKPRTTTWRSENKIAISIVFNNSNYWLYHYARIKNDKNFSLQCYDQRKTDPTSYIQKMSENEWYVRSTVMDMVNLAYTFKLQASGIILTGAVTRYENLHINKNIFSPDQLFDGSCSLRVEVIGKSTHLKDDWRLTKCNFKIIHKEKWEVISGTIKFHTATAL